MAERHEADQEKLASLMIEKEKYSIYSNRDQAIQRQLEEVFNYDLICVVRIFVVAISMYYAASSLFSIKVNLSGRPD